MSGEVNPRLAKLRKFADSVNKAHGQGTMTFGPKVVEMPRLGTGSIMLDASLGGGVPVGRCTMFWGKESAGKSYCAYKIAAENQNRCANCLRFVEIEDVIEHHDEETGEVFYEAKAHCDCYVQGLFKPRPYPEELNQHSNLKTVEREVPKASGEGTKKVKVALYDERLDRYKENSYQEFIVAIIDVESSFDPVWAKKLGIDVRRVIIEKPDTAEQTIDIYDSMMRTGAVDLMILDSLAQMTPSDEVEASTEEWQQGLQARLLNKLARKASSALVATYKDYGREVTQVWINQVRTKLHVSFGSPDVRPGGQGQNFLISVLVKLWASGWEGEKVEEGLKKDDEREKGVRVRTNFKIMKNKTAPPKQIGAFTLNVETGLIEERDQIISLCERYGFLIKEKGNKWVVDGTTHKTKGAAVKALLDGERWPEVRESLLRKMIGLEAA